MISHARGVCVCVCVCVCWNVSIVLFVLIPSFVRKFTIGLTCNVPYKGIECIVNLSVVKSCSGSILPRKLYCYLCQGGYVFALVCLFVSRITQNVYRWILMKYFGGVGFGTGNN